MKKVFVRRPNVFLIILATCLARAVSSAAPAPVFPLKPSSDGRYLVDQRGAPFLVVGDTPWSLIVQPEKGDISRYLRDRRQRGFNSIVVNLIEHKFCSHPPKTRAGLAPFMVPADFSRPNGAYFDFAAHVLQEANELGIVVWLAPAYLGAGGGDEGFFREMKSGGKEKLQTYGRFLGKRFKAQPNIVWLLGGDFTPAKEDQWTITELGRAILETDPAHPMAVHAAPEKPPAIDFGSERWFNVNTAYSYKPALFEPVLAEYNRQPVRPFVLIESVYEGEHNSKPDQIRRQAYWSMLGGACGQFLGNNPLWHFDGPGLYPVNQTWSEALDSTGSQDMSRLASFFESMPWQTLQPETEHKIVTDGYGSGITTALTAYTADHKLSVTYVPSTGIDRRELTLDLSGFPLPMKARWFNPCTARYSEASKFPLPRSRGQKLQTPGDNGTRANDWILMLESAQQD